MTIHTLGLSPALDITYELDQVTIGSIHRPKAVHRTAGGKSLNVARALARLGYDTRAIVPLGGEIGDLVESMLTETTVEAERLPTSIPTRLCVTAADSSTGSLTEFYEPVLAFDVPLEAIERSLRPIQTGEWLTVSGAIPTSVDAGELADLLASLGERGVHVAVDVHGPALPTILAVSHPRLVKVNRDEALEMTGEGDIAMSAEVLVAAGAGIAVVTDGAAGSIGRSAAGELVSQAPASIIGAFPVGSGDCFLAGLVGRLSDTLSLSSALAFAAAVGAANAAVPGAGVFDLPTLVA